MSTPRLPDRIETPRLVLRCWSPDDAPLLREAIDLSLEHLRPWLPWALEEPRTVEETRDLLQGFARAFQAGEDFVFGIFDRDEAEVVGGCGLHRRIGPGGLEIGYWIRADRVRTGLATEAARALTEAGLAAEGIDRVEIHCDPENVASRRIPERLGYRFVEVGTAAEGPPDGPPKETWIFEMRRGARRRPGP